MTLLPFVPRIAPVQGVVVSSAGAALYVLTASTAAAAGSRMRVAAAVVAATACLLLDDEAATTTAANPISRTRQRAVRAGVGIAFVASWFVVTVIAADALVGTGRPPAAAMAEVGALALIALAASCVALERTDDGRGGITGTFVSLLCFATTYLPPRWWWPLAAEPKAVRLALTAVLATCVALVASRDSAARRPRLTR